MTVEAAYNWDRFQSSDATADPRRPMAVEVAGVSIPLQDVVWIGPADPRERPGFGVYFSDRPATPPPADPPRARVVYSTPSGPRAVDSYESVARILARIAGAAVNPAARTGRRRRRSMRTRRRPRPAC